MNADLPARRLHVDLAAGFPLDWLGADCWRAQALNAASMTFPQGEQFFIDSLRKALPQLHDPGLREQVQGFIAQEATHRHVHAQYNAVLQRQGLRYVLGRWIDWRVRQSRDFRAVNVVAITAAYEHYTALLAAMVLDGRADLRHAHAVPRLVWSRHGAEELEHRAVALQVYRAIGGGTLRRVAWFAYVSLVFSADMATQTLHNLRRAGRLQRWGDWRSGLAFVFGRTGVLATVLPHAAAYLRPRFSAEAGSDGRLAQDWLARHAGDFTVIRKATPGPAGAS